jgi:hypothetical protein
MSSVSNIRLQHTYINCVLGHHKCAQKPEGRVFQRQPGTEHRHAVGRLLQQQQQKQQLSALTTLQGASNPVSQARQAVG